MIKGYPLLLLVLLILWSARTGRVAISTGWVYLFLATIFYILALFAHLVEKGNPELQHELVFRELREVAAAEDVLLLVAYLYFLISVITSTIPTSAPTAALWTSAVVVCFIFNFLVYKLLQTPLNLNRSGVDDGRFRQEYSRQVKISQTLIWGTAVPIALTVGVLAGTPKDRDFSPSSVSLLFVAMNCLYSGASMFRPNRTSRLPILGFKIWAAAVAILGVSALYEHMFRNDWYLYLLSSISFLGLYGTFLRVWTELPAKTPLGGGASLDPDFPK
jgi:hypothetical protein